MEIQNNTARLRSDMNPNTTFVLNLSESTVCFASPDVPLSNIGIYADGNILLSSANTDPTGNISFFKGDPSLPYYLAQYAPFVLIKETDEPWPRMLVYSDPSVERMTPSETRIMYSVNNYSGNTITMVFNYGLIGIKIQ